MVWTYFFSITFDEIIFFFKSFASNTIQSFIFSLVYIPFFPSSPEYFSHKFVMTRLCRTNKICVFKMKSIPNSFMSCCHLIKKFVNFYSFLLGFLNNFLAIFIDSCTKFYFFPFYTFKTSNHISDDT